MAAPAAPLGFGRAGAVVAPVASWLGAAPSRRQWGGGHTALGSAGSPGGTPEAAWERQRRCTAGGFAKRRDGIRKGGCNVPEAEAVVASLCPMGPHRTGEG
jgi:hypothetical protein